MTNPWRRGWVLFGAGAFTGALLGAFWTDRFISWSEPDLARYREVRDYARSAFVREVTDADLVEHALHGLANGLDDYSEYYDPREAARLERDTAGRYDGLGVAFKDPVTDGQILFPLAGSPAMAAGVRVGDRILRVGDEPFDGDDLDSFRAAISGPDPRDVDLLLMGLDGVERTVRVRTGSILEPTVRHERILDEERGVGYLAITGFSHETAGEFDAAFERLRDDGMRALLIDLRGNPGGVLVAAVNIARRFVREGLIVSTESRDDAVTYSAEPAAAWHAGFPLVLLVDEGSASASEVLASALQEHRVAVVVGSPTYGKGMVQTIHRFDADGSILKITSSYYFTPTHKSLEHSSDPTRERGVQPDLHVELGADPRALHARLARASAPRECMAALQAWQATSNEDLIAEIEPDPQLNAALGLFAGERPGPHTAMKAR
jgi:carboxyl-terminal processing protease